MAESTDEILEVDTESVEMELEMLKEIYINELQIEHQCSDRIATRLILQLRPGTGDDVSRQYVRLKLIIDIPTKYPKESPNFKIENSRGLSEPHIASIMTNCTELANTKCGELILMELIEDASNFIKTDCYHYFHNECIMEYKRYQASHEEEQLLCPICREPLDSIDFDAFKNLSLDDKDATEDTENNYLNSKEFKLWQKETARIYKKQLENGGIIDLEKERKRYLVTETTMLSPTSKQTVELEHDLKTKGKSTLTDSAHESPIKHDLKTNDTLCGESSHSVHVTESPLQTSTKSQKWDYRRTHKNYNKNRRSNVETNRDSNNIFRNDVHTPSNPNSHSTHLDRSANHTPNSHSSKSYRYHGKKSDRRSCKSSHSSSEIN